MFTSRLLFLMSCIHSINCFTFTFTNSNSILFTSESLFVVSFTYSINCLTFTLLLLITAIALFIYVSLCYNIVNLLMQSFLVGWGWITYYFSCEWSVLPFLKDNQFYTPENSFITFFFRKCWNGEDEHITSIRIEHSGKQVYGGDVMACVPLSYSRTFLYTVLNSNIQ